MKKTLCCVSLMFGLVLLSNARPSVLSEISGGG